MQVDPRLTAKFDKREIVAVYHAIKNVAGRATAKAALAHMSQREFAKNFDNAADDGFYHP